MANIDKTTDNIHCMMVISLSKHFVSFIVPIYKHIEIAILDNFKKIENKRKV